jgi:NAD+ synthase/NAD+ synthase (glutamine-hydrolysing)
MRVALLQIDPTAGDIGGNAVLIVRAARTAQALGAELAVTPELALMGYLPRDLLMNRGFVLRCREALERMAAELAGGPPLLVGVATPNPAEMGRPLFNSAVLLKDGAVGQAFHKTLLPTYDVFDEDRYFEPAHGAQILELNGWRLGISICEDVWNDRDFWLRRRYHSDPIEVLAGAGAQAILNLSACHLSPASRRSGRRCWGTSPNATVCPWPTSTRWAATTTWSSMAAVAPSTPRGA